MIIIVAGKICCAQIPQHKSRLLFNYRSIHKTMLLQKKDSDKLSSKKLQPMVIKKEEQTTLFTQLMSWDCKIKVKLSDNMNFILTYN